MISHKKKKASQIHPQPQHINNQFSLSLTLYFRTMAKIEKSRDEQRRAPETGNENPDPASIPGDGAAALSCADATENRTAAMRTMRVEKLT